MTGKSYSTGISHLCYRGARYSLSEIAPGEGEIPYKMGVLNINCAPPVKGASRDWMNDEVLEEQMLGVILVQQYNLKKGMELFGDRAKEATTKELQQIHDSGTYVPVMQKDVTREEKIKALYALMFIVEKRDGRVKARKVAVGSKQRTFPGYVKSEWSSPTVTTDGVIITSTIEAHEGRDVATADLPNAYLHADNNEQTLMLLKGKLEELMVQIDPELYRKYVITSPRGEPMLYSRLSKEWK